MEADNEVGGLADVHRGEPPETTIASSYVAPDVQHPPIVIFVLIVRTNGVTDKSERQEEISLYF
jgi:hypothetical protein